MAETGSQKIRIRMKAYDFKFRGFRGASAASQNRSVALAMVDYRPMAARDPHAPAAYHHPPFNIH